ncbi:MAG TPA: hypothetical protein VKU85_05610, partial [bacterium]|nr:hypothetical protein [bacterium]
MPRNGSEERVSDALPKLRARLTGRETAGIRRSREPVTAGVPLPRGLIRDVGELAVRCGERPVPAQIQATERWPDGSVRWALLDLAVDAEPHATVDVHVTARSGEDAPAGDPVVRVSEAGSALFVDAGAAQWSVAPLGPFPFRDARAGGTERLSPEGCAFSCTDGSGSSHDGVIRHLEAELRGPQRAVIRARGDFGPGCPLDFTARMHFHAGSPSVRLEVAVRNPRRAAHPGGHWELGDAGSFLFRDLSLRVTAAHGRAVSWSPEAAMPLGELRQGPLEIYQDSSGGENWRSPVHRNRDGDVPMTFRGYRVRAPGVEREGLRAAPRVVVHDGTAGVSASVREFWQNFPKAIEADGPALTVRLFPGQCAALHELQGGERKTHEIWLTFGEDALTAGADFQRAPLRLAPDPAAFLASGVLPYLTLRADDEDETACRLAAQAVEGDDPFAAKRERADEYGWRNWGDFWADHESRYHEGDDLFVSHFNNQYDPVWGALLQFARAGDPRWLELMDPLARHVMDIDVYHTDADRSVYNHGLFWHTAHYVHAELATHRSYPRGRTVGGGPDNEHNYAAGLAHFHLLTGDLWAREAAIERAEWVLAADDGSLTPLRWIAPGPTGAASKTREPDFHGPGRGAGNSVQVLLDAWRLTGEKCWLDKTVELLHRTI